MSDINKILNDFISSVELNRDNAAYPWMRRYLTPAERRGLIELVQMELDKQELELRHWYELQ